MSKLASATPPTPAKTAVKTGAKVAAKKAATAKKVAGTAKKTPRPSPQKRESLDVKGLQKIERQHRTEAQKKQSAARARNERRKATAKQTAQRAGQQAQETAAKPVRRVVEEHRKTASAVQAKYRKEKVLGIAELRPKVRMLAVEYIAAVVISLIILFNPDDEYPQKMTRFFIQMTGVSGIFFVLAMASSSEKTARYAIPFGLLVDIAMLIHMFRLRVIPNLVNPNLGQVPDNIQKPGVAGQISYEEQLNTYNMAPFVPPFSPIPGITLKDTEAATDQTPGDIIA